MEATSMPRFLSGSGSVSTLLAMPPELASLAEVAEILDVPKRTAARYVKREDFPEPVDRLAVGPIWRRTDVEQWGRDHLPLPTGRPRKPSDINTG
jgi:predicted DNA-binding transcriptional regulator AlpA